jgi:hypothetical protein
MWFVYECAGATCFSYLDALGAFGSLMQSRAYSHYAAAHRRVVATPELNAFYKVGTW